ncbi:MAG: DNA topoisomerase IB [Kofleriaceae bacterium]
MLIYNEMLLTSAMAQGDPVAAATAVALRYAMDNEPGIRRVRRGNQFRYVCANGKPLRDRTTLARIRALAIPPAWTDVWICPEADGHIQATGRDARGRKQYRYHTKFREVRDRVKYHRLSELLTVLPRLRRATERDLRCKCLCKRKVVATIVSLMERAQLRVGNDEYARTNKSYGATTLQDRHAKIRGATLELKFRAKGGIERQVRITDRKLAKIVRACQDLPGQRLFQYVDGDATRPITSTDVNDYVREVTGGPFTAKDYRTWAATLGACLLLCGREHPGSERGCKRCINDVLAIVAEQLGHTVAVCRKSYIHPQLFEDFTANKLTLLAKQVRRRCNVENGTIDVEALYAIEPIVARYLRQLTRRLKVA